MIGLFPGWAFGACRGVFGQNKTRSGFFGSGGLLWRLDRIGRAILPGPAAGRLRGPLLRSAGLSARKQWL